MYYSSIHTPIGKLMINANEFGITSVLFSDRESEEIVNKNSLINSCENQLNEYFLGVRKDFDLKLEIKGTLFQNQVWKELEKISFGKTCSYLDIAKKMNNVGSIRAVGTANGSNQHAIILPCHRVIGSDGKLTGYAGGLWRKKWLLDHEQKFADGVQKLF